jgi:SAM-dependent methyltransferase
VTEDGRFAVLPRLGIAPTVHELVREALTSAVDRAEITSPGNVAALDAGCGRTSSLRRFRRRIVRLVGADIHAPDVPVPYLDEFAIVDLCGPADAFPAGSFDIALSTFTLEHFTDPAAAMTNLHAWLRPGGTLVATTVNRRHPFVNAYLSLPTSLRSRVQPWVKATAADAHPLVGACNDPDVIRAAVEAAGFTDVTLQTVGHLARAWGRHWPTFLLGLAGDLLTRGLPSRRSTIVVVARA